MSSAPPRLIDPMAHRAATVSRLALSIALTSHVLACTEGDSPRGAFVGAFAFTSSSLETDCSPVPAGHDAIDDIVEVSLADGGQLAVSIDALTVPCTDEAELQAEPRRIGCELENASVRYQVDVWIDLSYAHPSRMRLHKLFAAPAACFMTFSGLLAPAP